MGFFDIFKKRPELAYGNDIYELLFCDNPALYKNNITQPFTYPWNVLLAAEMDKRELNKIVLDEKIESRAKLLAFNKLAQAGQKVVEKELLGVIAEIGLPEGLDVLAAYADGSARYINQSGKMIIWEASDNVSVNLTNNIFESSYELLKKIGPWDKPRRPAPKKDTLRVTFLVSDGLYFGEGPINVLFSNPLAGPVLASAMELMKYLIKKTQ